MSRAAQDRAREFAVGYIYWLLFLTALGPRQLAEPEEVTRILTASLLGAVSAPILLALMRRFPIEGRSLWRHVTIHSLSSAALAFALIFASCVLAVWFQIGDTRPVEIAFPDQIAANWMILILCLWAFIGVAHAVKISRAAPRTAEPAAVAAPTYLSTLQVKSRGRTALLPVADIDWIETQGNYLALHAGTATHLIRETSQSLEAKLDPRRFARIHRRIIVAVDRIHEIAPLQGGDATLRLSDGTELRVSRGYRNNARAAFDARTRA